MTTASLLWGVLFGSLGAGYCLYGWKQRAAVPLVCGVALSVLPYLISNTYAMVAVSLVLAVAPFVVKL